MGLRGAEVPGQGLGGHPQLSRKHAVADPSGSPRDLDGRPGACDCQVLARERGGGPLLGPHIHYVRETHASHPALQGSAPREGHPPAAAGCRLEMALRHVPLLRNLPSHDFSVKGIPHRAPVGVDDLPQPCQFFMTSGRAGVSRSLQLALRRRH